MKRILLATAALLWGAAAYAQAPAASGDSANMAKLQDFHSTGTSLDIPTVPQTGPDADQLRANLKAIHLPPGFKIDLYAVVPDARMMAVGNNAGVLFVSTRKTKVWAVTDRTKRRVADEVKQFAPSLDFHNPNGICFSPDGVLYVAENSRVRAFPAAEFFYEEPDVAVATVSDPLIPKDAESFNHGAHYCRVSPVDNKLYIELGQPYNVPPKARLAEFAQWGVGGIIRMNRDGTDRETYASGIRNSEGMDWNPKTHDLWFTDNQVDGMGDDIPPGELNHATRMGENFGFPWYGGGHTRTVEYKDETPAAGIVFPDVETIAHAADLGMTFYTGKMFPPKYRGALFSTQHGSWNRTNPIGARVMVTFFKPDGTLDHMEPFAEGWLNPDTGEYSGRPVDVAMLKDGSLLVSDDQDGAIYRISYSGK